LTQLEVDTVRVALALLLESPPAAVDHARDTEVVEAIANDEQIAWLRDQLAGDQPVRIGTVEP
jgi:hypothetical protein